MAEQLGCAVWRLRLPCVLVILWGLIALLCQRIRVRYE
jgi:hypothetical protein